MQTGAISAASMAARRTRHFGVWWETSKRCRNAGVRPLYRSSSFSFFRLLGLKVSLDLRLNELPPTSSTAVRAEAPGFGLAEVTPNPYPKAGADPRSASRLAL